MPDKEMLGLRPKTLALWTSASLLFVAGLFGSAKTGIRLAEERVPPESVRPAVSVEMGVKVEAKGMFVFAATQQELRQYIFREDTTAGSGMAGRGEADVFEFDGPVVLYTVGSDIDLIKVEIVTGPRVGEQFWMRGDSLQ